MYIFISHSSTDSEIAKNVCDTLDANKFQTFLSSRDIKGGAMYAEELIDALDKSDVLLLLLSKRADASPHVLREVERACSKNIPIVVYKLEDFQLSKAMEYFIMTHQWVARKPHDDLRELVSVMQNLDERKKGLPVLPVTEAKNPENAIAESLKKSGGDMKKSIIIAACIVGACLIIGAIMLVVFRGKSSGDSDDGQKMADASVTDIQNDEYSGKHWSAEEILDALPDAEADDEAYEEINTESSNTGDEAENLPSEGLTENEDNQEVTDTTDVEENLADDVLNSENADITDVKADEKAPSELEASTDSDNDSADKTGADKPSSNPAGTGSGKNETAAGNTVRPDDNKKNDAASDNGKGGNSASDKEDKKPSEQKTEDNAAVTGDTVINEGSSTDAEKNSEADSKPADTPVNEGSSADTEKNAEADSKTEDTADKKDENEKAEKSLSSLLLEGKEIGDSVSLGHYNGQPIEWRVLHFNDNGTVILVAKNIITMKCFDSPESGYYNFCEGDDRELYRVPLKELDYATQIEAKGNNSYADSNIRNWLNSSSELVRYTDSAPKISSSADGKSGYDLEPGFLNGFTAEEREALTAYSFKSKDINGNTTKCSDKVFLLSEKEFGWLSENDMSPYAKPTAEAVAQDKSNWYNWYKVSDFWPWWLRDLEPGTACKAKIVGSGASDELVYGETVALEGYGIRPAICLKK